MDTNQTTLLPANVTTADDAEQLNVMGSQMSFGAKGDELGAGCTQFTVSGMPGVGVPMHVHDNEDELFLVLEGAIRFELAGQAPIIATAGTSVYGPRDVPHTWRVVGDGRARAVITVLPGGLERMFRELAALPAGDPDFGRISEICGRYGVRFV